jgi:hypothetical protein
MKKKMILAWRYTPIILTLRRYRQEDHELEASLSYTVRACLKNNNKKTLMRKFLGGGQC